MIKTANWGRLAALTIGLLALPSIQFAVEAMKLTRSDLQYIGAFRISQTNQAEGKTGWASGKIAISSETNSFFFGGAPFSAVAEFRIPEIVNSTNINDLAFTGPPIQAFSNWEARVSHNTEHNQIRNIGGMDLINRNLVISVFDPYDAASVHGFDIDNQVIIENAFDLANSAVTGYFQMEGKMKAAGWLSPIPTIYQDELGGDYLTGSARMASINGRWSLGPSAYSLSKMDLLGVEPGGIVKSTELQHYPMEKRLWWQLPKANNWNYSGGHYFTDENCPPWLKSATEPSNESWKAECVLQNDLWTEVSRAFYGAIIPGTQTYLTLGRIGGARKGIAYKNFPINGGPQPCSGECPYDYTDWDNMVWMFDVQDLIDHKNGLTESYDAMPYEYGPIKLPFDDLNNDNIISTITGADYDPLTDRLYIVLGRADSIQNKYEAPPIILVYEIALNRPKPPRLMQPTTIN